MTLSQLEAVVHALVEIVDSWNEAAADEDRGRANDALCLTLWGDGRGRLGRRSWGAPNEVEDFHDFGDLDQLAEVLADQGAEFDDSPPPAAPAKP